MLLRHRFILTALCCAGFLPALPGRAADGAGQPPVPVERFFNNQAFSGAKLSPDARLLATKVATPDGRDSLAVVDLINHTGKLIAGFNDADIGQFYWVNSHRIVFDVTDHDLAQGQIMDGDGLYAVDSDGTQLRQLVERNTSFATGQRAATRLLPYNTYLAHTMPEAEGPYVYVTSPQHDTRGELNGVDLRRLDTLSGLASTVKRPGKVTGWVIDQLGEPRIATTLDRNLGALLYRDPATDTWRKLAEFDAYLGGAGAMQPVGFGPDGTLYVSSSAGRDKVALYRFDLATGKREAEPLVALTDYDFVGSLMIADGKLLGVSLLADASSVEWFDARMKAVQQRVDKLLPATNNLISVASRAKTPWMLVQSYSDVQPRFWTLFNTETGALNRVGSSRADIDPARMGHQEPVRYKARDGLTIPAWLTLPRGKRKNLPLVVLVHGGPYVRGTEWRWDPQAQFLASRGYAVLEPEYRGSTGFGNQHARAGWKQWGLGMQDDIADGAKWAIAQGIVDPKRICIAGASYGGYATLMGLLNDPDLYQCGIDWVGVTDIKLLYTGHWSFRSDMNDGYRQYGMPDLVGDVVKDAEQLKATSPLVQAARIKLPLLLAYGGSDRRVPIYHGRKFYDAVKPANPNVEMVVYEEEGHGWALPKTRIDFWKRVEQFLDRHIGESARK